jgi:nucleotide-binding universal stress UspA family protein
MTTIIVGVEDSDRSIDAVSFARRLARTATARLILANAYRRDGLASQAVFPILERRLRDRAADVLARMREDAGDVDVETRAIADSSPARALVALAEREKATLIAIGSSHRGDVGRVLAGTTAERLLQGSPCPVAVVPKGHVDHVGGIRTILVAYDGSVEAKAALNAAMTARRALSAAVRVVRVVEPLDVPALGMAGLGMPVAPEYAVPPEEIELELRRMREAFETDIDALPDGQRVQSEFVMGSPVAEIVKRSRAADLLVTGSRGYGARRAVLLGAVSGRLVREAACPVIVVPRDVESHLEQLFIAPAASRAA